MLSRGSPLSWPVLAEALAALLAEAKTVPDEWKPPRTGKVW